MGAAQRIGFVLFMSIASVVSSFARMGLAVLTAIPPDRPGCASQTSNLGLGISVRQCGISVHSIFLRSSRSPCSFYDAGTSVWS